jgi:hypothetical protein
LQELVEDVVFIGGALAPLFHTNPPFDRPRPTRDVDGVVASTRYSDVGALHERLLTLGFRQNLAETSHVHRWWSPDNDILDLVPAGEHLGGTGQIWDQLTLESSVRTDLGTGASIRHASAALFLALKWAAYADRGAADPFASHDLEDILALLASRPSIVDEVRRASPVAARFIASGAVTLVALPEYHDLIAAHLNNAQDSPRVGAQVRERLDELAGLPG